MKACSNMINKHCENCIYYEAFYRKGIFGFWKENNGICKISDKNVNADNNCRYWYKYTKQKANVFLVDRAIDNITYLIGIYKR